MNQFTTETIVNSNIFEATKNGDKFIAKKLFAFKKDYIKAVYKTASEPEVNEVATVTIPTAAHTYTFEGNTITSDTFRLHIEMKTVNANISEFQNSLTRNNKEYNFEVKFDATSGNMATAFKKAIEKQNNESKNPKFKVSVSGDVLTLTAIDGFTRFNKIEVQALETNYLGYNAFTVVANGNITTPGNSGFGTTNWFMRNFRIPTYVNTNWLSLRQDDRPIPGVNYTQYTFHVEADRGELTGMGAVGQKMTSKTTHVLYVADSVVLALDTVLSALSLTAVDYDVNKLADETVDGSIDSKSVNETASKSKTENR